MLRHLTRLQPVAALKRTARAAPRVPGRGDMASDDDDGDDEDDVQQYQMAVFEPDTQQSQMPVFEEDSQQVQLPVYGAQQAQRVAGATGQLRLLPASNNQVEVFDKPRPRPADLSRDTLVNRVLEQQHRHAGLIMVDPDAELMEVRDGKVVGVRSGRPGRQTQTRRTEARASAPW